ncbi:MAG: hypothetical protein IJY12_02615 [Clostridia bacterium]|nr:hypothetical protein [Clostridia bacterium]
MRNKEEFKEEVLRRAEAGLRRKARRKRQIKSTLSMAACFAIVIGIVAGAAPLLNRLTQDGMTGDGPVSTSPLSTPADTTSASSTPYIPEETTPTPTVPLYTPTETTPAYSTPPETVPVETTPAGSTPAETVTAETTPSSTSPSDTTDDKDTAFQILGEADIVPPTLDASAMPEEFQYLFFDSYDAYKESPYYVNSDLPSDDFEGSDVYLIRSPAPDGQIRILASLHGETLAYTLTANVHTESGSYCAYILFTTPTDTKIHFQRIEGD